MVLAHGKERRGDPEVDHHPLLLIVPAPIVVAEVAVTGADAELFDERQRCLRFARVREEEPMVDRLDHRGIAIVALLLDIAAERALIIGHLG